MKMLEKVKMKIRLLQWEPIFIMVSPPEFKKFTMK